MLSVFSSARSSAFCDGYDGDISTDGSIDDCNMGEGTSERCTTESGGREEYRRRSYYLNKTMYG